MPWIDIDFEEGQKSALDLAWIDASYGVEVDIESLTRGRSAREIHLDELWHS